MAVKQKSIKVNFVFNIMLNISKMVFPLITFPYVSRILSPEGIGRINYVSSIVNYLSLLAELGVHAYGVKEGAKYRDDKEKLGKFVSEMLLINLAAIFVSFIILGIILISGLKSNITLILIYATLVFATPFSINWFVSLMEEYRYITFRTLFIQSLSMILIFALIRDRDDLIKYAVINALTGIVTMAVNLKFASKYIKLFRYKNYEIKKHLRPIFLIFGSSISENIYVNSDITILGYLRGDYFVGIYSSAVKIVRVITTIIQSLTTVLTPRIAYYKSNQLVGQYKKILKKGTDFLLVIAIPASIGIFLISGDIVEGLLGNQYLDASLTMKILAFDIVLSPIRGIVSYQIVLPHNKERVFFWATFVSCIFNVTLNIILIPKYAQNAAAYTTVLSQLINILICCLATKGDIDYLKFIKSIKDYIVAASVIIPIVYITHRIISIVAIRLFVEIIVSAICYAAILLKMKNEMAVYLKESLLDRLKNTYT